MPALTLQDVFTDCQKGLHTHGKLIKNIRNIYNTTPLEEFWNVFVYHVKYAMVVFEREPTVERSIEFAAKFATSLVQEESDRNKPPLTDDDEEEEMHPFLLKFFSFLLSSHNANDKAVRFRVCQLINKLLNSMGETARIDDDLYDHIYECMLLRLRDKFPVVRVQAVLAMTRLQDPKDNDCPVINAFLFLLSCDPNSDVRRAVLSCIAASTKTLPGILERTRDTKETVRRLAYQVIAEKIHIKALTIAQRISLLQEGLNDRTEVVRDACTSRLLQAWLRLFEGNILELLKRLDVETAEDTCQQVLISMFAKVNINELITNFDVLNENLVVSVEEIDPETVMYWRSVCQHISALGVQHQEQLDKVLPTASNFAQYIEMVVDLMKGTTDLELQLRNDFILHQLLQLATLLDLSDEAGRRLVQSLLRKLMLTEQVGHSLVKPLLALFNLLHPDPEARINQLIEIISDIRMPITEIALSAQEQRKIDLKVASMRVELNQLREELDTCIHEQRFAKAADVKAKVEEIEASKSVLLDETAPRSQETRIEKNDASTLLKCLTISSEMLQDVDIKRLLPSLQTLMETLIVPGVQNADPAVRKLAVHTLGLCCLLHKHTATTYLLLFIQVSRMDIDAVRVTALDAIFDLLLVYGIEAFNVSTEIEQMQDDDNNDIEPSDAQNNTSAGILSMLVQLLDTEMSEARSRSAEGLSKLMLAGHLKSPKLLSRLLLLWYNPITEDDNYLRHCLGAFFPVFAFAGKESQAIVEASVMPTIRTLLQTPANSPLSDININNVAELFVQLTDTKHLIGNRDKQTLTDIDSCPHDGLALQLANEILSAPTDFGVRPLCHMLLLLDLCPTNTATLSDLCKLADNMAKEVKDKQCVRLVEKFQQRIAQMLDASVTPSTVEQPQTNNEEDKENVERHPSEDSQADSYITAEEDSSSEKMDSAAAPINVTKLCDETVLEEAHPNKPGRRGKTSAAASTRKSNKSTAGNVDQQIDSICTEAAEDKDVFMTPPTHRTRKAKSTETSAVRRSTRKR